MIRAATGPQLHRPPRSQRRIRRLLPNLLYCMNTGYLLATAPGDDILYTRYFILAYGAALQMSNVLNNVMLPVDPASIICTCDVCTPAINVVPVTRNTIVAYAKEVPSSQFVESNEDWLDSRPAPSVYWSTRSTTSRFLLKWSKVYDNVADARYYEVFSYRDFLPQNRSTNPWKRLAIEIHQNFSLTYFQQGGLYHYTVRSIDEYGRHSPFSKVASLFLPVI